MIDIDELKKTLVLIGDLCGDDERQTCNDAVAIIDDMQSRLQAAESKLANYEIMENNLQAAESDIEKIKTFVELLEKDNSELQSKLAEMENKEKLVYVSGPGQINEGDWLSFEFCGERICTKAKEVLNKGSDREEIIYNRKKNHYFITSMVADGTSNHKNVFVIGPKPSHIPEDKKGENKDFWETVKKWVDYDNN